MRIYNIHLHHYIGVYSAPLVYVHIRIGTYVLTVCFIYILLLLFLAYNSVIYNIYTYSTVARLIKRTQRILYIFYI